MSKPMLLDLFCGAGGASMGYHQAGYDVVGVDIEPQKHYPFEFVRANVFDLPDHWLECFDAIHASPPCQDHSSLSSFRDKHGTGWMLEATINRLRGLEIPWVIENVVGATVTMDGWWFQLCGSSFGLRIRRHRRFGSNRLILAPACRHREQGTPLGVYGKGGGWHTSTGHQGPSADVAGTDGHALGYPGRDRSGNSSDLHQVHWAATPGSGEYHCVDVLRPPGSSGGLLSGFLPRPCCIPACWAW